MKNVLLLVHDDDGQEARLQCALDLTRALGGHLSCVDVLTQPRFMDDFVSTGGEGLLVAEEEASEARNRQRLEGRLGQELVSWSWIEVSGTLGKRMRKAMRLQDIVVLNSLLDTFPDREMAHAAGDLIVNSGRPLLAVPEHASRFNVGGHAMVAWDGSGEAEAAMRAAVPLLALASAVTLLEVEDGSVRLPAEQAATYLSRHGIRAIVRREPARQEVASAVVLREIRRLGADWLVMGGFGHRRLVEAVFGGVTRQLFCDSPVPLFLAH